MKTNDKYLDVYSYSSQQSKKITNSRGSLKSVLCFFVALSMVVITSAAYCFGAFVQRSSNESAPAVNNYSQNVINESANQTDISNIVTCVFGICIYNGSSSNYASGVSISGDGYIITNDHVFSGISSPKIVVFDNLGRYYNAAFVGGDSKYDIAVIKIEKTEMNYIKFDSDCLFETGDKVYSIGCPMDESLSMTVTSGIISGINRRINSNGTIYPLRLIQTDAAINPGSSGGLLINSNGQAIGLNCSKIVDESYEGVGFAIPAEIVNNTVYKLIESGCITDRAQLGISYSCNEYTEALINNTTCGILINSIKPMSDLYGKGVNIGDTIISIDGKRIYREGDFLDAIESRSVGDSVTLTISTADRSQFEIAVNLISEKSKTSYIG